MREALIAATQHALTVRGTVMLEPGWCAICASVQGDLELRVGEPRRRKRRRWLEDNGFTHRVDAWSHPLWAGAGPGVAVETLAAALEHGLGLDPDTRLRQVLVQPGVVTAADATHADALTAAFTGLNGRVYIELGRPAEPLAWVAVDAGELVVEVDPDSDEVFGRYRDPREAADALVTRLGRSEHDPLFIALLDS